MMPNELQLTNLRMIQMFLDRIQMKMPQPTRSQLTDHVSLDATILRERKIHHGLYPQGRKCLTGHQITFSQDRISDIV